MVAEDEVRKVEGDRKEHLNACNVARQASTSDTQKLDAYANADFATVINLYDQQDEADEAEEAYKARNKAITCCTAGALVLMIAKPRSREVPVPKADTLVGTGSPSHGGCGIP